jgi:hypothetical protein
MTYRKFPSRYGWDRPRDSYAWRGWTIGIRLALPLCILWVLLTNWKG